MTSRGPLVLTWLYYFSNNCSSNNINNKLSLQGKKLPMNLYTKQGKKKNLEIAYEYVN